MHVLKCFWIFVLFGCSVSVEPLAVGSCEGSPDKCGAQSTCRLNEGGLYRCVDTPSDGSDQADSSIDQGARQDSGNPQTGMMDVGILPTDSEPSTEPNCNDGILNNEESDLDCGGPCVPCDNNNMCGRNEDCMSTICQDQICVDLACDDSIQNGQESDVDCGGGCEPCAESKRCDSRADCQSGVCIQGLCVAPACDDRVLNGSETNVDCGGDCPSCIQCNDQMPCTDGSFCSDGQCTPQLAGGQACTVSEICQSGYCSNGFCCDSGECCDRDEHCAGLFDAAAQCDSSTECRGHRTEGICQNNRCESNEVPDDSACTQDVIANDCGPYRPVRCDGGRDQAIPQCPVTCARNSDCDAGYRCDGVSCVVNLNLPNGAQCAAGVDCASGHCQNGFCCESGECCNMVTDCSHHAGHSATCDNTATCQGSRSQVDCTNHRCLSQVVEDDSACTDDVVANHCALYPAARCNGQTNQSTPSCSVTCTSNEDCDTGAWCNAGQCNVMLEQPNGDACTNPENCASGHCQNGFCCDDTNSDCCNTSADCPGLIAAGATCDDVTTCQGSRAETACVDNVCSPGTVADDSGCAGRLANECGLYPEVFCTDASSQSFPGCPVSCESDSDCDPGAHCDEGSCLQDLNQGQVCDENSDCASGHCQNGFCCNSGDCCSDSADCPAEYSSPAECTEPTTCQGSRIDATCTNQQCASVTRPDDSACDSRIKARECNKYRDIICNGLSDQTPQNCATTCQNDLACATGYFCLNGRCFLELDDICIEDPRCGRDRM